MIRALNWKEYSAELIVVILGITIAFQVEEFAESRRLGAVHETLANGLSNELELNIAELTATIEGHEAVIVSDRELVYSGIVGGAAGGYIGSESF